MLLTDFSGFKLMKLYVYQELEALADPMRKEVALVRKKIDSVNKELKPLGHTCQKKVKPKFDASYEFYFFMNYGSITYNPGIL